MNSGHYIYGLFDPRTGELRYIGKCLCSIGQRLSQHLSPSKRTDTHNGRWIGQLTALGLRPQTYLIQELSSSIDLALAERYWIKYFRDSGCRLTNLTDGGEGAPGHIKSKETRMKLSMALKGKKLSDKHIQAISIGAQTRLVSNEVKDRLRAYHLARLNEGQIYRPKLTNEDVTMIKSLIKTYSQRSVAKMFNVSHSLVSRIKLDMCWRQHGIT